MKIGVLTSSRADFGIYLPLLKKLKVDRSFNLKLIVFGTHLSKNHGYTANQILESGFNIDFAIDCLPENDSKAAIAENMGEVSIAFAKFWNAHSTDFDLVLALGDRFELFAALSASIPFGIRIAHFHGGETSLGAIDNVFRHCITQLSSIHFPATKKSAKRIETITGSSKNIFTVGSMSLDNLNDIKLLSTAEFRKKYGIDPNNSILVTYHPETINLASNKKAVQEITHALAKQKENIIITLPNNDPGNEVIRDGFIRFAKGKTNVKCFESLGTQGYFSVMKHCEFLLGNTSSGIIEAASFGKYVINIGDRQKGRECGKNVLHCTTKSAQILTKIKLIGKMKTYKGKNCYGNGQSVKEVIKILKKLKLK